MLFSRASPGSIYRPRHCCRLALFGQYNGFLHLIAKVFLYSCSFSRLFVSRPLSHGTFGQDKAICEKDKGSASIAQIFS